MATEYVDAGQAVDNSTLSGIVGHAPPVAKGVTYERILNARSEPQNWLTYYGAYDGQRYSPLDQINKENVKKLKPAWVFQCGLGGPALGQVDVLVRGLPARRRRRSCSSRAGTAGSGPSTPERDDAVAVPACVAVRRVAVLRQRQPRRRGGRGQGLRRPP